MRLRLHTILFTIITVISFNVFADSGNIYIDIENFSFSKSKVSIKNVSGGSIYLEESGTLSLSDYKMFKINYNISETESFVLFLEDYDNWYADVELYFTILPNSKGAYLLLSDIKWGKGDKAFELDADERQFTENHLPRIYQIFLQI